MHNVITIVKDEKNNLMFMAKALHSIIDYHIFKIQWIYEGTCFGHTMSKAYRYATNDEKVITSLKHVNVKATQGNIQKPITWTKKLRK
jgi:hypothetical protein